MRHLLLMIAIPALALVAALFVLPPGLALVCLGLVLFALSDLAPVRPTPVTPRSIFETRRAGLA